MIRMYEDFNYKQNRNTTYGDQKMVEEFNKPYPAKETIGMDKIILKRVDFTACKDCVFYSVDSNGCGIDTDSGEEPFACRVGDKNMMWVRIEN